MHAGRLRVAWEDDSQRLHAIDVQLDAAWLAAPSERRMDLERTGATEAAARELRAWGSARGLTVRAEAQGLALNVSISGPADKVRRHGPELEAAMRAAQDRANRAAGLRCGPEGGLLVDLPAMAARYVARLAPLAQGLLATVPGRDYATYAGRVLAFVQSIPYVTEGRQFTLPAGVLAEDRGDCDEKCLVMLALLKAVFPSAPAIVVQVPQHMLLGIPVSRGPHRVSFKGVGWALCEPAGPALVPIGTAGPSTIPVIGTAAMHITHAP